MKKLREETKVTINDDELNKVTVDAAPAGAPMMPGMQMPVSQGKPMPVPPMLAKPATTPTPPPTAASKIGGN
jgi:hypothetical protein